jgi:hypothetical protein
MRQEKFFKLGLPAAISICSLVTDVFCSHQAVTLFCGFERNFRCWMLAVRLIVILGAVVFANQLDEKLVNIAGVRANSSFRLRSTA